ncbi:uncharacterized protein [Diabrotica undecimpunctata]|uniref:uncharacterized protein n=1 Tax=Diabrotica undecimpunctata TaxID=50387 RepID=UPI003B63CFDB
MSREVIKMKQGMSYSCKEKIIILNVFKYFSKMHPEKCVTEIVRRTSKATGCSEKSIFQFRKEEDSPQGFKEPSKTKVRKNLNINSRFLKYDEEVRESIKEIIYDLKYRNIVPSLSTILKNVKSNSNLPNFSLMTLRRLLFDMGFYYQKQKNTNKAILVEKNKENAEEPKIIETKDEVQCVKPNELEKMSDKSTNMPETVPENHAYMPNPNHGHMPLLHFGQNENHIMDGVPVGFQHQMMLDPRIHHPIHPIPHSMGFLQYPSHHHNMVTQQ